MSHQLHSTKKLPDIGHMFIPRLKYLKPASHVIAYGMTILCIYLSYTNLGGRAALCFLVYINTLQFSRCVSFILTIIPDASQVGHLRVGWKRYFIGGLHDLIPSGHVIHAYAPVVYMRFVGLLNEYHLVIAYMAVLLVCIIAVGTRSHYSIDVMVAIMYCHGIKDLVL